MKTSTAKLIREIARNITRLGLTLDAGEVFRGTHMQFRHARLGHERFFSIPAGLLKMTCVEGVFCVEGPGLELQGSEAEIAPQLYPYLCP